MNKTLSSRASRTLSAGGRFQFFHFCSLSALLALALAGGGWNARAGTTTWNVVGGGTWTTAANWTTAGGSTPPATNDSVVIDQAISSAGAITSAVKATILCNDITFGGAVGGTNEAGWVVSGSTMTVSSGNFTVNQLAAGQAVTMSDASKINITSRAVTKMGPGTLILSGAMALTQNSNWVQNGTLALGQLAGPGFASSGTVTLGDATGDGGQLVLGDANGATTMTCGSLRTASGAGVCSVVGGASAPSALTYHPVLVGENFTGNLGGGSGNQANLSLSYSSGTSTLSGNCEFTGGLTMIKGTLTLTGSNTAFGGLIFGTNAAGKGVVVIGSPAAFPAGDGLTAISATSATVDLAGNNVTMGAVNVSAVQPALITNSVAGTPVTLTVGQGNSPVSVINGGRIGGALSVVKVGSGTATFSTTNAYTGATVINNGTLALSGGGAIASSPTISIAGGATFDVSGMTTPLTLAPGQALAASGTTAAGILNLGATAGLTMAANSPLVLAYEAGQPPLQVKGGALTLASGNPVTVNVAGSLVSSSSYLLISAGTGGSVAGAAPASVTINNSSYGSGSAGLAIASSGLWLLPTGGGGGGGGGVVMINSVMVNGATISISGSAGATNAGASFSVVTNADFGLAHTGWQVQGTGLCDGSGNFSYTNAVNPGTPVLFYDVHVP